MFRFFLPTAMLLSILSFAPSLKAQYTQNIHLLGQANDFPSVGYNDVWGFTDSTGLEYAIIGTRTSTLIYSLEDPSNPVLRANIPGATSTWRDMKSWKNYVYVIADRGADGILKIDMKEAPETITHTFTNPETLINGTPGSLSRGHNIFIDEKGYLYASGTNLHNGGVIIFDLAEENGDLIYAGAGAPRYSHDNYVHNDILWSADIYEGIFSAQDVADKNNITTLGFHPTSSNFTHNLWLSDDGKYLFTTDEVYGAYIDAYDVSDLEDIKRLSSFRPAASLDLPVVPHNTHYANGYLVISWYSEGLVVVDAHRPENLIQVGQYDTFEPDLHGFYGCWGAFPFLPSGNILASDIQSGLFILEPAWQRACYLEGEIRDQQNSELLNEVNIHIESDEANNANSNPFGLYKTGLATPGTYTVTFSKAGYHPQSVEVNLASGAIVNLDIALEPLVKVNTSGLLQDKQSGMPIAKGEVLLENDQLEYTSTSDESGQFSFTDIFENQYNLYAGAWGYFNVALEEIFISGEEKTLIQMEPGYADDFLFDLGWETSADASVTGGRWERAVPAATYYLADLSNPAGDLPEDIGNWCYVTGNNAASPGADDVDGGAVTLSSPMMNLSTYASPTLEFAYWFYNGGGSSLPNDTFFVEISNGMEQVRLASYTYTSNDWIRVTIENLQDFIALSDQMQIHFIAADDPDQGHLVEAGVDGFAVYEALSTSVETLNPQTTPLWELFPNPASDYLNIRPAKNSQRLMGQVLYLEWYNFAGQRLGSKHLWDGYTAGNVYIGSLSPGLYLLKVRDENGVSDVLKFMKK